MVIVLTTPIGSGHIDGLVKRFGRSFGRVAVEMTYEDLIARDCAPRGTTYIFTDFQRMSPPFVSLAIELWRQLEAAGGARLFSNPGRQLGRFGLLRELWKRGSNQFNVWLHDEIADADIRFPVFIRLENDHSGPKSGLIEDKGSLLLQIERSILAGADPRRLLVVEFLETVGVDGVYRKYGAIRFGSKILCQHILQGKDWNVKTETRTRDEATVKESDEFFLKSPHAEQLMPYFETAGIEYGRIDYGMLDGKIQVWEINDNPVIAGGPWRTIGAHRLSALDKGPTWFGAFAEMARGIAGGPDIELDLNELQRALDEGRG